jgi:hypothetical protein
VSGTATKARRSTPSSRRAAESAERCIVKYARLWCKEAETVEAYESLRGTQSAAASGAFICLYEAVEDLERLLGE